MTLITIYISGYDTYPVKFALVRPYYITVATINTFGKFRDFRI